MEQAHMTDLPDETREERPEALRDLVQREDYAAMEGHEIIAAYQDDAAKWAAKIADEYPAEAVIEGDNIVIRMPVASIPVAFEACPDAPRNEDADALCVVIDATVFAKGIVRYLNREEEDGTTRVHVMFDRAMIDALEQGEEGVEESTALRSTLPEGDSPNEIQPPAPADLVATAAHAAVRDGDDIWHVECRLSDGQKFAAVQVDKDAPGAEAIAHAIAMMILRHAAAPETLAAPVGELETTKEERRLDVGATGTAYRDRFGRDFARLHDLDRALARANAEKTARGAAKAALTVKPLEWRKPADHPQDDEDAALVADGIGGRYSISKPELTKAYGPGCRLLWNAEDNFSFTEHVTLDAAKAAAQAGYEARIRAALADPKRKEK